MKELVSLRHKLRYSKVSKASQASTHSKDRAINKMAVDLRYRRSATAMLKVNLSLSTNQVAWFTHHKTVATCNTTNRILILHMANNKVKSTSNVSEEHA